MPDRIYLAGPDVFLPDAEDVLGRKKALCEQYGFVGVSPLDTDLDPEGFDTSEQFALAIYDGNEGLIRGCQILIANLTPFRGPSADVGTVLEVGLATGLGLCVLGYSNDPQDFATRSREFTMKHGLCCKGIFEDFGLHDNLMIDGALEATGGMVVPPAAPQTVIRPKGPVEDMARDLIAFERCLELAQRLPT